EIARESLERYRFSWPEAERQRYAARIISKMTLWETGPIERYEVARGALSCAVLHVSTTGDAKVIAAGPEGVLIILIPPKAPPAWTESPAIWVR
ncbi:MAG TPA: hypothetical protein VMT52_02160, partial [Planctomycetota bacterium]|nr:hypothetical protein [Planctomycetota bacterium]